MYVFLEMLVQIEIKTVSEHQFKISVRLESDLNQALVSQQKSKSAISYWRIDW